MTLKVCFGSMKLINNSANCDFRNFLCLGNANSCSQRLFDEIKQLVLLAFVRALLSLLYLLHLNFSTCMG